MTNDGSKSSYWRRFLCGVVTVTLAFCVVCAFGSVRDGLLAPWFWVYIVADAVVLDFDLGRWPPVNFGLSLAVLAAASRWRLGVILAILWILVNMLSAMVFLQKYQG
jgi:hypothetical protein